MRIHEMLHLTTVVACNPQSVAYTDMDSCTRIPYTASDGVLKLINNKHELLKNL